jgi:hypothetical protein
MMMVHFVNNQLLSADKFLAILDHCWRMVFENTASKEKIGIVEELIENIFIFITGAHPSIDIDVTFCQKFADMKRTEFPGISSRAVFKCLDILDQVKKVSSSKK